MRDLGEKIEQYRNMNRMYHFEGESGLQKFEKLLHVMGYKESSFRFGTTIESFLCDNPGAVDALVEWISNQHIDEWEEAFEEELPPEEPVDEDDEDYS